MNYIQTILKAIVPIVIMTIFAVVEPLGITEGMTLGELATLTGTLVIGVWAVPNK